MMVGHQVSDALVDDADVGVHQVTDGLHLPLQLRVHGEGISRDAGLVLRLRKQRDHMCSDHLRTTGDPGLLERFR